MYDIELAQIAGHISRARLFLGFAFRCDCESEAHGLRELEETLTLATTLSRKLMADRRMPVKTRRPRGPVAVEVPLPFED